MRARDFAARRNNGFPSYTSRENRMVRKRRTDFNPWGEVVDRLIHERKTTQTAVGEAMRQMGFPRKHPKNALGHAMSMKGIKAVTYIMTVCVGQVLELDDEEWQELHHAGTITAEMALQISRLGHGDDLEEDIEDSDPGGCE